MKKIDIHTHILPPNLSEMTSKLGDGFITLEHTGGCKAKMLKSNGEFFREVKDNCWDPQKRISEFSEFEVDAQVLSTIPILFSYWASETKSRMMSRFLNEHIADVVKTHPDRFYGLGTLPMQYPDIAVSELEYCMKDLGLQGIEIGSHINSWNLNDKNLYPFYEAAEDLGAAIFIHPWDMMGMERMNKYWLPWLVGMPAEVSLAICSMIFGGIFERFPKLKVAFAHGGGSFSGTLGRVEHGFNSRPDLCAVDNDKPPSSYLGKFFVDSLVHDEKMLHHILDLYGEDKVMLGTDYPFPLGELETGKLIDQSNLNATTKDKILWKNAFNWLGIENGI